MKHGVLVTCGFEPRPPYPNRSAMKFLPSDSLLSAYFFCLLAFAFNFGLWQHSWNAGYTALTLGCAAMLWKRL